jgi:hypothetical protein
MIGPRRFEINYGCGSVSLVFPARSAKNTATEQFENGASGMNARLARKGVAG